jgi:hypothetical protein
MLFSLSLAILPFLPTVWCFLYPKSCDCGFFVADTKQRFTHAIYSNFSAYDNATSLNTNPKAKAFSKDWMVQSWVATPRAYEPLPWRVDEHNVWIESGQLKLRQAGYSSEDALMKNAISGASIVSRVDQIYHGSFRVKMRINGARGGSVAAFYWYQVGTLLTYLTLTVLIALKDDDNEIDIEILTREQNQLHYTIHPSLDSEGEVIPQATSRQSLSVPWSEMQEYRFDWNATHIKFYQDKKLVRTTTYHVPKVPGSIHLDIWASGGVWSGFPSATDVTLEVDSIIAFYNTTATEADTDLDFTLQCGLPYRYIGLPGTPEFREFMCRDDDPMVVSRIKGQSRGEKSAFPEFLYFLLIPAVIVMLWVL